jgi:hypothetical protein
VLANFPDFFQLFSPHFNNTAGFMSLMVNTMHSCPKPLAPRIAPTVFLRHINLVIFDQMGVQGFKVFPCPLILTPSARDHSA